MCKINIFFYFALIDANALHYFFKTGKYEGVHIYSYK